MPLSKSTKAGTWIRDYVHSTNSKFAGKSPEKRKQMALAAYYGKQNEEINMSDLSTLSDKEKNKIKNRIMRDALKTRHRTKESHKMSVKDMNKDKKTREAYKDWDNHSEEYNAEEQDMTQIEESKYGSTHEFRGSKEFMDKHAEKILKKHNIQVHSIEILPDEKEVIFHVSGSLDAINKATVALYDETNTGQSKILAYKPAKFYGSNKKYIQEEVEMKSLADVLNTLGVELTEEQLNELSNKTLANYVRHAAHSKGDLAFDTGNQMGLRGLNDPKRPQFTHSDKEIKRTKGIFHATHKISTRDDITDFLNSLGIELTEEQDSQLNTYIEETENEETPTTDDILADGPKALLTYIADENEDTNDVFSALMTAKVENLLDAVRQNMANDMFSQGDEEEVTEGKSFFKPPTGYTKKGFKMDGSKAPKKEDSYDRKKSESVRTIDQMTRRNG